MTAPNFSAYPWSRVPRVTARDAQVATTLAGWIAARGRGERLARLLGDPVEVRVGQNVHTGDPHAARCALRVGGISLEVAGASAGVRAIAQRLLGGPAELAAPRPLGVVERALWALVVATAVEDLGIDGQVWPLEDGGPPSADDLQVALELSLGGIAVTAVVRAPGDLVLRAPPPRPLAGWTERARIDVPVVLGRCAILRSALAQLTPRSLVTLAPPAGAGPLPRVGSVAPGWAELALGRGAIGLRAASGAVVAEVTTGYVRRAMSLPDDAHVELTVALGTTELSLRQICELTVGQIVPLGRPLAGPFEVRAAGRVVGRGELVDVDGELAVRIVSVGD